jgi:hypothetical protein
MRAAHVVRKAKTTMATLQQKAGEYAPKVSLAPKPGYDAYGYEPLD